MGLLDRFRAQPRWKNANPAVRIAAVEELPLDQQDTLVGIARDDRDAGVRVAALRKVIDPAAIAAIGRADADERVREEGVRLLVDLASGEFEGTDQAESLAALSGLTEPKHLVAVARQATNETVARQAVERLHDDGSLAAVARKATLASIRLEALARVGSTAEVLTVALRSDYKDAALAAVERLSSRELLGQVADRAKNKTAAKRARVLVRASDAEAEAAAQAAAAAASAEDAAAAAGRQRAHAASLLCRRLEVLASSGLDEGEAALAEIDRSWQTLDVTDGALVLRFQAARASAETALSQHLAEDAERTRARQENARALAARQAICERTHTIAGDDTPARIDDVRAEWAALPPLADAAEAQRWSARFEEVCRGCLGRHDAMVRQRANREQAAQLCAEAERLAGVESFLKVRGETQALRRAWHQLLGAGFDDVAVVARFDAADAKLREGERAAREERSRALQENLGRLQSLCTELEAVAVGSGLTLKQAERALREARAALDEGLPLPTREDREAADARLKAVLSALFPKVQELRDMDEWQRWANAGVQEELCQRVEALMQVDDLASAARQLREAQAQWKQVANAPREQSQVLWTRFKAATDAVRARCDVYFAQLAEEQASNKARKESLCERAEALAASTDWIKTAEAIKALQAEWKSVGPAPRAQEKVLWERFHAACDGFFTRRRTDLQQRKQEWAANLARKEAICGQAEVIAETTEWQKGIEEIKRLQAEWKTIGPVRKTRADEVWLRFRAACDRFFEAYQNREHAAASSVIAEAEAVCQELEALVPPPDAEPAGPPDGLAVTVGDIRKRWADRVAGLPRERAIRLGDRYTHALARLVDLWPASFAGTDIDPEANARRLEDLCGQVEGLLAPESAGTPETTSEPPEDDSPATLLARQLREALATNTIAGRQDESAKWKAASEHVRAAQAAWKKVGPVPEAAAKVLNARFQRACAKVAEKIDQQRRGLATR
jgi:DNA repair protein SbcC/Rad50